MIIFDSKATRLALGLTAILTLCSFGDVDSLRHPEERHLRNIRQLTFGGTNAEAYFSFDETKLIFQTTREPYQCDQMFVMNIDGSDQRLVSPGNGITTCGYFLPDNRRVLYSSTHVGHPTCYPRPDKSKGYVWGVWNDYDVYVSGLDGAETTVLSSSPGYDAEATISPTGERIVFTSTRDGDLELYTMNLDGSDVRRVTNQVGYDGGANFSWNGKRLVWRAYHPADTASIQEYRSLLADQLVRPTKMELFVGNADGTDVRQLTRTGSANFAPVFHPNDKRIVYSSNATDPKGHIFHLYMVSDDGSRFEQITHGGSFNSFPMFTRDGKKVVFVSDRNAKGRYEFNIFIADWVE